MLTDAFPVFIVVLGREQTADLGHIRQSKPWQIKRMCSVSVCIQSFSDESLLGLVLFCELMIEYCSVFIMAMMD